jgi:hypothetical protein
MKNLFFGILALSLQSLLLSSIGCDAGYSYGPEGWAPQKGGLEWVKDLGRVKILTWGISELTGSESITPEFEISNQDSVPLVVESASLFVEKQVYRAQLPGKGALQWRLVPPGAVRRVALQWSFEESAWKALGSNPKIILNLYQGKEPVVLEIRYARIE